MPVMERKRLMAGARKAPFTASAYDSSAEADPLVNSVGFVV